MADSAALFELIALLGQPWAISDSGAQAVARSLSAAVQAANPATSLGTLTSQGQGTELAFNVHDGVAVIPVSGVLTRDGGYRRGTTYTGIRGALNEAVASPRVRAVVLDVNSPGGVASEVARVSDLVYSLRETKPITAAVSGEGLSAAYWIASGAQRIVAQRDALLGSIGTRFTYLSFRKMDEMIGIEEIEILSSQSPNKTLDPETDAGRAQAQHLVDGLAEVFVQTVARNRGVPRQTVLTDFGAGGIMVGQEAVDAGLADGLGTLDEVVAVEAARAAA